MATDCGARYAGTVGQERPEGDRLVGEPEDEPGDLEARDHPVGLAEELAQGTGLVGERSIAGHVSRPDVFQQGCFDHAHDMAVSDRVVVHRRRS